MMRYTEWCDRVVYRMFIVMYGGGLDNIVIFYVNKCFCCALNSCKVCTEIVFEGDWGGSFCCS